MKLSVTFSIVISILACLQMAGQDDQWFLGFSITPQHSFIFNKNDRIANSIPRGTVGPAENGVNQTKMYPTRFNHNGYITPNSINISTNFGYAYSENFSFEGGFAYSYQEQLYGNEVASIKYSMHNNFNFIKFSMMGIYSIKGNDVLNIDIGLGVQPIYLINYEEGRINHNTENGSKYVRTVSSTSYTDFDGAVYKLNSQIFNKFNLEGKALLGLRWGYDYDVEYFFRLTVDHSLFDIENKSAVIQSTGENYYEKHHDPYKFSRYQGMEWCPDCEETRPASYNFTAGISVGMRFYLN